MFTNEKVPFINDKLILYEIRIVTFLRLMSLPYE